MWYVCSRSGRQGNIQAGILDLMGLLLSWVTCHMSRNAAFFQSHHIYVSNFHLVISLPYGVKTSHIQWSLFLVLCGNWSERTCNNCLSDTYPGQTVLQFSGCLLEMLDKWLFWEKLPHPVSLMKCALERKHCFCNRKWQLKSAVTISRVHYLNLSEFSVCLCSWLICDILREQIPD